MRAQESSHGSGRWRQSDTPSSAALELAVHHWPAWLDSLREARRSLARKIKALKAEPHSTPDGLATAQLRVWDVALEQVRRLRLPDLWAPYWIACLLSDYDAKSPATWWRITCPPWAEVRAALLMRPDKPGMSTTFTLQMGESSRGPMGSGFSVPPLALSISYDGGGDLTVRIPLYLLASLAPEHTPLGREIFDFLKSQDVPRHELSGLLRKVGRPLGGDAARRLISVTPPDKLSDFYKNLLENEYLHELLEYGGKLTEAERRPRARRIVNQGSPSRPVTFIEAYERETPPAVIARVKARVRKRVRGWFKQVGRWPLPPRSKSAVKAPPATMG